MAIEGYLQKQNIKIKGDGTPGGWEVIHVSDEGVETMLDGILSFSFHVSEDNDLPRVKLEFYASMGDPAKAPE